VWPDVSLDDASTLGGSAVALAVCLQLQPEVADGGNAVQRGYSARQAALDLAARIARQRPGFLQLIVAVLPTAIHDCFPPRQATAE